MGLDARETTPLVLSRSMVAVAETRSFQRGAILLDKVGGVELSAKTLQRLTKQIGGELADCREARLAGRAAADR